MAVPRAAGGRQVMFSDPRMMSPSLASLSQAIQPEGVVLPQPHGAQQAAIRAGGNAQTGRVHRHTVSP